MLTKHTIQLMLTRQIILGFFILGVETLLFVENHDSSFHHGTILNLIFLNLQTKIHTQSHRSKLKREQQHLTIKILKTKRKKKKLK